MCRATLLFGCSESKPNRDFRRPHSLCQARRFPADTKQRPDFEKEIGALLFDVALLENGGKAGFGDGLRFFAEAVISAVVTGVVGIAGVSAVVGVGGIVVA